MFKILRMGCNSTHENSFAVNRPNGYEWYLLLLVKSPALFNISGELISTPPNTLIIYDRNSPHDYRAFGAEYNRVGEISLNREISTSHTTVRTVRYTAVQST